MGLVGEWIGRIVFKWVFSAWNRAVFRLARLVVRHWILAGRVHGAVLVNRYFDNSKHELLTEDGSEAVVSASLILIVEDDYSLASSLCEVLQRQGFETSIADSCSSAISALSSRSPDIILSDVNMPGKSGVDLFKETRLHSMWSDIPFIFISGLGTVDVELEALRLGADSFIRKPIQPAELVAVVKGKLTQQKVRQERYESRLEQFRKNIIHTLSHEFRTPLVSITTGTEILIDEFNGLADEQIKTLLESILRGGQRLERLVDDFMTMKNIDIGYARSAYRSKKSPIELNLLVNNLEHFIRRKLDEHSTDYSLQIDVDCGGTELVVEVMEDQVSDALFRLVENAIKFSTGSRLVTLHVAVDKPDLIFSVRDYGVGFPEKLWKEGVLRFSQLNRDFLEQQGCGVGLNIASYYVSLHEGEISLRKPNDRVGALIEVRLPINPVS